MPYPPGEIRMDETEKPTMNSFEKEKPDSFTIRGKNIFGTGEAEPLVFERVGTTGAIYKERINK